MPVQFYICGVFRRQQEFAEIARQIEESNAGWSCCAGWLTVEPETCDRCHGRGRTSQSITASVCSFCGGSGDVTELFPGVARMAALADLEDVRRSDVVLVFTEEAGALGRGRGGRHVEFGFAYAKGKPIAVIGSNENIFCHLVPSFGLVGDAVNHLKSTVGGHRP